jgi:hypothetical protein
MEDTVEILKLVVGIFGVVNVVGGALVINPIRNHFKRIAKIEADLNAAWKKIKEMDAPKCEAKSCPLISERLR